MVSLWSLCVVTGWSLCGQQCPRLVVGRLIAAITNTLPTIVARTMTPSTSDVTSRCARPYRRSEPASDDVIDDVTAAATTSEYWSMSGARLSIVVIYGQTR